MKIACLVIVLFLAVLLVILLIAFSSHVGASSGKMSRLLATIANDMQVNRSSIFAETVRCDGNWRSIRDGLVNSMLAFSIICVIISIPTLLLVCSNFKWDLETKENQQELEDFEVSVMSWYLLHYNSPLL